MTDTSKQRIVGVTAALAVGAAVYYYISGSRKKPAKHILGCGNPLLDISSVVGQDLLDKYGLQLNNAILAEEKHLPLYDELVKNYPVEYIAGGATLNSIRVAQWMIQQDGKTSFIGAVGPSDANAKRMAECSSGDGVNVSFCEIKDKPTGTCAVLVKGKERSLVANLSAAEKFPVEYLSDPKTQALVTQADIIYSAGFFITTSVPSLMLLAEACLTQNKIFCMNLSAPFITQFFTEPLLAAMQYVDYIFGNESEAEALGQTLKYEDASAEGVAKALASLPSKSSRPRVAVITQGSKAVIVATSTKGVVKVTKYPVPPLDKNLIVDSNGAGDAFVGGFLSQLAQGKDMETCIAAGSFAARTILQVSGTKLSGRPSFSR